MQRLLHEIMHASGKYVMSQMKESDLNQGQIGILFKLEHKGGISQSELARQIHLTPPSITVALNKLEKQGLILRKPNEKDQRMIRLEITEKGKERIAPFKEIFNNLENQLCLGMSPEEVLLLKRLLKQMKQNIQEIEPVPKKDREGGTHD